MKAFIREHAYGLSDQAASKWLSDALKQQMVRIAGGILFLWIPYLLLQRSPTRWWLYTGLLVLPFIAFMMVIGPVFIDPMFNTFGPMKDKGLETKILSLADRAGIQGSRVYEVDKSNDTKHLNAYVTGVGSAKRIVLWDTLLKGMNEREVLAVMAHEMGHYVLGHVWKGMIFLWLAILATLYAIHRTAGWMIEKYHRQFGFGELSNIASMPLLLLLMNLYLFIAAPGMLAVMRHMEHEADRFALELTHDNHALATVFTKLVTVDLVNPRPARIVKMWRNSHPTLGEEIDFANSYRPWETHQPLKYEHLFRKAP